MSVTRGPDPRNEERQELILHTLKKHGSIGFNKLHEILRIEIGSKETLSKELISLIKKREIKKDENEKYSLLGSSLFNAQFELMSTINEYINKESDNGMNGKKLIDLLTKWSGILSMYCAIKQIETGREWTRISSGYATHDNGTLAFLKRYIIYKAINPKDLDELRISWSSELNENKETRKRVMELLNNFKSSYQTEIELLDTALLSKP
jgi:hypothetical protein